MGARARAEKRPIFWRDGRRGPLIFYSSASAPKTGNGRLQNIQEENKNFHAVTEIESQARSVCRTPRRPALYM